MQLKDIDEAGRAFIAAGWMGYLPGTAFDLYSAILQVRAGAERATEDNIRRFLLDSDPEYALGEFDAPVEPNHGEGVEAVSWDLQRWSVFRGQAASYGLAVSTPNQILAVLCELGLIERDGVDAWSTIAPVPLLEDVVNVSHGQRRELARMRARVQFTTEERLVSEWLATHRESPGEPVVTSVAALAEALRLPPAAVRGALSLLIQDGVVDTSGSRS